MISVVLVDDDPAILSMLKDFIPWQVYNMQIVESFTSSLEALEFLWNHTIQLVFTDLVMPQMDGITLIQKAIAKVPQTIFVALSSHDDFKLVKNVFLQGASDYILKEDLDSPLFEQFLEKMQEHFEDELQHPSSNEVKIQNSMKYMSQINQGDRFSLTLLECPYKEVKYTLDSCEKEGFTLTNLLMVELEDITCIIHKSRYVDNLLPWYVHLKKKNIFSKVVIAYSTNGTKNDISALYYKTWEQMGNQKFFKYTGFPDIMKEQNPVSAEEMTSECLSMIKHGSLCMKIDEITASLLTLSKRLRGLAIGRKEYIDKISYVVQYFSDCFSYLDGLLSDHIQNAQREEELMECSNITQVESWIVSYCKKFQEQLLTSQKEQFIPMIQVYLEHNFTQQVTLKEVAALFHISEGHLSRSFYQATKIHIKEYLNVIRIERAKLLLSTTQLTINDISECVGYQSVEHFFRTFKKLVGIPPNQYRNL